MSLPTPGITGRMRASSATNSQPIPRHVRDASVFSNETATSGSNGSFRGLLSSFRGQPELSTGSPAASSPLSQRDPTRTFFHSSFRGSPAPVDSEQNARQVRADTAELATYGLTDQASSTHSGTGSPRPSSLSQQHLEDYFPNRDEEHIDAPQSIVDLRDSVIEEVSEPVTPEERIHISPPGVSALTDLIRRSPPSTSPPDTDDYAASESVQEDERGDDSVHKDGRRQSWSGHRVDSDPTERSPLLGKALHGSKYSRSANGHRDIESNSLEAQPSWPQLRKAIAWPGDEGAHMMRVVVNPKLWNRRAIYEKTVKEPIGYLPAVMLGCLLNVLDALSYGIILFPLGNSVFEDLGPAGIAIFYVSTIVSQVTFSSGFCIFKGGVGSEMIEVVPFFHKMAFIILEEVGEQNPGAVRSTTIVSMALSSILTGMVFFLMGYFKFGYIVGFIPRHILTGCIGGVGWFLFATGVEVTARLDGNLNYDGETLRKLFAMDTFPLWIIPVALATICFIGSKKLMSNFFLPGYIVSVAAIFYFFVFAIDELDLKDLRQSGWIFTGPETNEPWYQFYKLYDFTLVEWKAVLKCVPSMLALTFFGILHVPINVPALAFKTGEDNMDVNRELIAHGISNALSGSLGSIQNYLVYTNSVIFIKSGGKTRMAGLLLAVATFIILLMGPGMIQYIPVMIVGILILVLGMDLLCESLWETRHMLKLPEFLTVIAIVVVMGTYDFVWGVFIGIILAFISLVVQTSRVSAIRASFSGDVAGSTVRRNPGQQEFLRRAGGQIHITKLSGFLFFGTIVDVEEKMRILIDEETFSDRPIRYLIFDLGLVTGVDYSSAEIFNRLNRLFSKKGVSIVICGIDAAGPIGSALLSVGLGEGGNKVAFLPDLNQALEGCENELLKAYYASQKAREVRQSQTQTSTVEVPRPRKPSYNMDIEFNSPRRDNLHRIAHSTLNDTEATMQPRWQNFKEPLRLILQTFHGLTRFNEDFWFRAVPYFTKKEFAAGTVLFERGIPANGFYLLQEGILRADYAEPQGHYCESIVAGTTCGELPFFSDEERTATVVAERDCITWRLDRESWDRLQKNDPDLANELLQIALKLTKERMSAITNFMLTMGQ